MLWYLAQSLSGNQPTAVCSRGQILFPNSVTSSLMTWAMEQGTSSARLQRIQNWEEWLVYHMAVLAFRETSTSWRNGPAGTSWTSADNCQILHLGWNNPAHQYPLAHDWLESSSAGKDIGVQLDPGLAMCSCNKGHCQHGLHGEKCCHQVKGNDPVLFT